MINKETPRKIHLIRKKMWDASINNFKRYLNKKTGLIKKNFQKTEIALHVKVAQKNYY